MGSPEFWCETRLNTSSHTVWKAVGLTSEASLDLAADAYFAEVDKGTAASAPLFLAFVRRAVVFTNLSASLFRRQGHSEPTVRHMQNKVLRVSYDSDVDGILDDGGKVDEEPPPVTGTSTSWPLTSWPKAALLRASV